MKNLIRLNEFNSLLPKKERMITAHYDNEGIYVYQAYSKYIAGFAEKHQFFGGDFKLGRMTWVKPNFLWMMHRSGWASKKNQEQILMIKLSHSFFLELLSQAVLSSYYADLHNTELEWKEAMQRSEIRVQWDPGYDVFDQRQNYRNIQIGIKGKAAIEYATQKILSIEDITSYVLNQKKLIDAKELDHLELPEEKYYPIDSEIGDRIKIMQNGV